jgi:hypothetical protein
MAVKSRVRKGFKRLVKSRKGTAEIVGSIMFLLILLFFFTNVYLWHDRATRGMDDVLANKMNSPVSIKGEDGGLIVTNNGGVGVALSRLWIIDNSEHVYANLEDIGGKELWVAAGESVRLELSLSTPTVFEPDGSVRVLWTGPNPLVQYQPLSGETFRVLTVLGNTAACGYVPPETP